MVKNNKITMLYKNIEKTKKSYSGCKPYVRNIIKVPDNDKDFMILDCAYYSDNGTESMLYGYKKGKIQKII